MIKRILKGIFIAYIAIMLIWFAFPVLLGIFNLGNATGIFVFGVALICCVIPDKVTALLKRICSKLWGKAAVITAALLAAMIAITAVTLTVFMTSAAYKQPSVDATVIVLGCRVYGDRPSKLLTSRVNAAYDYLSEHEGSVCIVSGGQGDDENISEAECMRRMLTEKGIAEDRIFLENESTSTRENIEFSNKILQENNLSGKPVAIATNEFHQFRAQLIAKEYGIDTAAISGASELYLLPSYYVRELYGVLLEIIT